MKYKMTVKRFENDLDAYYLSKLSLPRKFRIPDAKFF